MCFSLPAWSAFRQVTECQLNSCSPPRQLELTIVCEKAQFVLPSFATLDFQMSFQAPLSTRKSFAVALKEMGRVSFCFSVLTRWPNPLQIKLVIEPC